MKFLRAFALVALSCAGLFFAPAAQAGDCYVVTAGGAAACGSVVEIIDANGKAQFIDVSHGLPTQPSQVTLTNKSGTITTGGTAQNAIASNSSRKFWCIQNPANATEDLYVRGSGTASSSTYDVDLAPGGQTCNPPGMVSTAAVSVVGATTAHAFAGVEGQ